MTQRRNTRQRQLVLAAVTSRCDHPTADEIYLAVRAVDERISRGTVYRNLNLLARDGEIQAIRMPGSGGDRFDRRCDSHCHLVCRGCGNVIDAPLPYAHGLDSELASRTGWEVDAHHTLFDGLCPACRAELEA